MIGNSITHCRITAKLGEGGMGEVYRASDTAETCAVVELTFSDPWKMIAGEHENFR